MHGQHIGYIRVSTLDQHTERQLEGIQGNRITILRVIAL
jgi:DNA invertase Pin-like site-specific DNA recombinase